MQASVTDRKEEGEKEIPARLRFMCETLVELKNNRFRASEAEREASTRLRKVGGYEYMES